MLNIVDLEKRWIRYKIKSYIPHFSIFISLMIIVSILLSFLYNIQEVQISSKKNIALSPIVKEIQNVKEPLKVVVQEPIVHPLHKEVVRQVQAIKPSNKRVSLSPSLDFMRNMQNSIQPYYKNDTEQKKRIVQKVQAPNVEVVKQQKLVVQEYAQAKPIKVKKISIKRQNTQNDIYEIITRFKKNNNPALSLFVAKKYYELQDYQQAYNYALITNKINKDIESSWIIFSKSLVKLGKRDKAISTLKQYIKQSHSSSAHILLDEIYAGRFK
ncbi:Transformation system protein [hydrothermal vent metagenome]|uniref:Transformation system protein n=1 Tax=hydrothermal vent metagenome TaxID=652676 RepID=A0A1W1CDI1_9ZZZZ